MNVEPTSITLAGFQLHRLIVRPEGPSQGSLIFLHGQGDYIDRYPPVLKPYLDQGITCILTDLPGHGRSAGKRGHVPSLRFIDELMADSRASVSPPYHLAGHSMGGLLALRSFLQTPSLFASAWFSSPLLEPGRKGTPWTRAILPLAALAFPWITWGTGVSSSQCRASLSEEPAGDVLYHSKISLGWIRELMTMAAVNDENFLSLSKAHPVLFTQGEADPICPASILRLQIAKLSQENITYREIPNGLHEPFMGETADIFKGALEDWLTSLRLAESYRHK